MKKQPQKSNQTKKKITINTNPNNILLGQQNLNRGILTSKTTNEGPSEGFKNHSAYNEIKTAITPGVIKNNIKKGLLLHMSQNLQTKKLSAQQTATKLVVN